MLRRKDPDSHIPIVLLSVAENADDPDMPAEAQGLVTKPVEEDALLAELARVLCGPI